MNLINEYIRFLYFTNRFFPTNFDKKLVYRFYYSNLPQLSLLLRISTNNPPKKTKVPFSMSASGLPSRFVRITPGRHTKILSQSSSMAQSAVTITKADRSSFKNSFLNPCTFPLTRTGFSETLF